MRNELGDGDRTQRKRLLRSSRDADLSTNPVRDGPTTSRWLTNRRNQWRRARKIFYRSLLHSQGSQSGGFTT